MMPNWTPAQKNAIESRGGTLLVSAAAGSGKTAVLVERVIQIILDEDNPVDVDKLLIVTFTNAAAAEMRDRIRISISEKLASSQGNLHLKRQEMLIDDAQICTIDAFCKNIVKENFYALGIQQDFEILDDARHSLLKKEAMDSVMDSFYLKDDKIFSLLIDFLSSSKNDNKVVENVFKIYDYVMAYPFPKKWLNDACNLYESGEEVEKTVWGEILITQYSSIIDYAHTILDGIKEQIEEDVELEGFYSELLKSDFHNLDALKKQMTWNQRYDAVREFKLDRFSSPKGLTDHSSVVAYKNIRTNIKKIITEKASGLICATVEQHASDVSNILPVVTTFVQLIEAFMEELMKIKIRENAFSFADIEHFAINLLVNESNGTCTPTKLAKALQSQYFEILLDEYQDTNKAQEMLFNAISKGDNVFMVGDVKQSIYRFRQAMPQIFIEKKEAFAPFDGKTFPSQVVLDKNFRSQGVICDFINFVFEKLFSKEVGDIEYGNDEKIIQGASNSTESNPNVTLSIIDKKDFNIDDKDELEALYLADLIEKKIKNKEKVLQKDGTVRDIKYGDIAILLRSASSHAANYVNIFRQAGIPIIGENKSDFFKFPEISIIISLLRIIDNPMQDIPLLSVMSSAIYGFTPDEFAQMRISSKGASSFYICVVNYGKNGDGKTTEFLHSIERMRMFAATMSAGELLRRIFDETSFFAIASSMGNSEQRRANLNYFIEYADKYEKSDNKGLSSFVRYIDMVINNGKNIGNVPVQNAVSDCVRIMTIHHSKGLEFPVCIVAGVGRQFNKRELRTTDVHLNPSYGIGMRYFDDENSYKFNTIPYRALYCANESAEMSENIRVLYVAMTRAKEQLIFVDVVDGLEKVVKSLSFPLSSGVISPYVVEHAASYGDWLLSCALLHPDGGKLRELCAAHITVVASNSRLNIEIVKSLDVCEENEEYQRVSSDTQLIEKFESILSYEYPYKDLASLAAKRNASSLDEKSIDFNFFASSRPAFSMKDGLTGAQKGTAIHNFMQNCDYENCRISVEDEAKRLTEKGYLLELEYESLDIKRLRTFFTSDLASRMFSAKQLFRESKFATFVDGHEIYPQLQQGKEKVYIQGIADCVFVENNELIIIDYKTDKVDDERILLDRYKNQLYFYCEALKKIYKMPVKECMLYSFHLNKPLSYDFISENT